MNQNDLVKAQFNIQADQFATWNTTINEDYNRRFFQFCGIKTEDHVLDVACGSGAFAIHCAQFAAKVSGVDISDNMLAIGQKQAEAMQLNNIDFQCHRVEELPKATASYSVVLSKAAYHHFPNPETVFSEMKRCCKPGGRICIQDILAYSDSYVDDYFERLEKAIDRCHYKTWPKRRFLDMFESSDIVAPRAVEVSILMDVEDYISHAVQDDLAREEIHQLLQKGMEDPVLAGVFVNQNGRFSFKRNVLLIRGQKAD